MPRETWLGDFDLPHFGMFESQDTIMWSGIKDERLFAVSPEFSCHEDLVSVAIDVKRDRSTCVRAGRSDGSGHFGARQPERDLEDCAR